MKKFFSILLAVVIFALSFSTLGTTALAAEASGKCGTNATWSFDATTGTLLFWAQVIWLTIHRHL